MTNPADHRASSSLSALFASPALGRLVVFFALRPGTAVHIRALQRATGLSLSSLQNELGRLTRLGAVSRTEEGRRVLYRADESHPAWLGWRTLIRGCADPTEVLREAFAGVTGIEAAFLFGSTARGDARPDSDLDLFVVGSEEARREARSHLAEAEYLLDREVDLIGCDRSALYSRLESGNPFARRVMEEPKEWIVGGPQVLREEGG